MTKVKLAANNTPITNSAARNQPAFVGSGPGVSVGRAGS
jgi:hypothetical protein